MIKKLLKELLNLKNLKFGNKIKNIFFKLDSEKSALRVTRQKFYLTGVTCNLP